MCGVIKCRKIKMSLIDDVFDDIEDIYDILTLEVIPSELTTHLRYKLTKK
jgi:hypothetical protein